MYAQAEKSKESKNRAIANSVTQKKDQRMNKLQLQSSGLGNVIDKRLQKTESRSATMGCPINKWQSNSGLEAGLSKAVPVQRYTNNNSGGQDPLEDWFIFLDPITQDEIRVPPEQGEDPVVIEFQNGNNAHVYLWDGLAGWAAQQIGNVENIEWRLRNNDLLNLDQPLLEQINDIGAFIRNPVTNEWQHIIPGDVMPVDIMVENDTHDLVNIAQENNQENI